MTLLSVPTNVAAKLTTLEVTDQQRKALELLTASPKPLTTKQLMHRADCGSGPISTLRKKGFIHAHVERLDSSELAAEAIPRRAPQVLNPDQVRALGAINRALDSKAHQTLLLHGVTGSGKTEVYIQAIQEVVSFGRQAIVLVPEISLTPQTVGRFRERFDHVAVLHSHLSDVERHGIGSGSPAARCRWSSAPGSAVFAPTPHLGLIVIDEEHETIVQAGLGAAVSCPRRGAAAGGGGACAAGAGEATPSLESWHRAMRGESELVEMPRRVNRSAAADGAHDRPARTRRTAARRARSAGRCRRRLKRRCGTAGR